jgi:tripartite ATP-independent transporter DctM subunit
MRILFWLIGLLAVLGTPIFALMGGASELAWLTHPDATYRHLRYIAPTVLDDRFAGSPILVTIPLFTFVGYLMAESKTPDRIVQASRAFFGWMPGGLALVAIAASAFFTTLTGGSGVTIVAIGGLLYPALRKQKYPDDFSLGLVTTGGSLGLLLPPSLPILIYALVAGIDFNRAFKAAFIPGILIMVLLYAYSAYVGIKAKVPRDPPRLSEMGAALWLIKWELLIPVVILGGLMTGLTSLDESAAIAALYTFIVEVFIFKDLSIKKDLPRVAMASMGLAGAVILILAMANALINFVVQEQIPGRILDYMVSLGMTQSWQFLIVLNIFLLVLGMVMDGFSAILVAVPLVLPFAARFHLNPFHMAVMFLLNLELAFLLPPLGLNLFISSFRFNRPVVSLYRIVLPFAGLVAVGLALVMYLPSISTVLLLGDMAAARAEAKKTNSPPREAWQLECVQEDHTHPMPCTPEEIALYGNTYTGGAAPAPAEPSGTPEPSGEGTDDDLFRQMVGGAPSAPRGAATGAPSSEDDLFREMVGAGAAGRPAAPASAPAPGAGSDDDLFRQMVGAGADAGTH